ncbi:MAG: hypothetical protein AAFY00_09330, partial [Bacteroidota bacterium]
MNDPRKFYDEQVEKLTSILVQQKKKLTQISLMRIFVFLITCGLLYVFSGNTLLMWTSFILGAGLFLFLLRSHTDKKAVFELNKEIKKINEEEIEISKGNYLERYDGHDFEEPSHFFS